MTATDLDTIARAIHARLTGDPRLWAVVDEGERMLYRLAAFDAREVSQQLREPAKPRRARGHSKSTA